MKTQSFPICSIVPFEVCWASSISGLNDIVQTQPNSLMSFSNFHWLNFILILYNIFHVKVTKIIKISNSSLSSLIVLRSSCCHWAVGFGKWAPTDSQNRFASCHEPSLNLFKIWKICPLIVTLTSWGPQLEAKTYLHPLTRCEKLSPERPIGDPIPRRWKYLYWNFVFLFFKSSQNYKDYFLIISLIALQLPLVRRKKILSVF